MTDAFYEQYARDHRGDQELEGKLMNEMKEVTKFKTIVAEIFFITALEVLSGEYTQDTKNQT